MVGVLLLGCRCRYVGLLVLVHCVGVLLASDCVLACAARAGVGYGLALRLGVLGCWCRRVCVLGVVSLYVCLFLCVCVCALVGCCIGVEDCVRFCWCINIVCQCWFVCLFVCLFFFFVCVDVFGVQVS